MMYEAILLLWLLCLHKSSAVTVNTMQNFGHQHISTFIGSTHSNNMSTDSSSHVQISEEEAIMLRGPVTFEAQGDLPRLPIPTLQETMTKLPQVLWALQTETERERTKEIIAKFMEKDGPELQELLEQYEAEGIREGTIGSYVEEFWNDSYLAPDDSVVLNLNPFFVLEEGPDAKTAKRPILRAASLTFASVKLASLLKHETLVPDVFKGKALCMDQFKVLFGSCRLPELEERDHVAVYPDSTHVAVMCRNQLYYFQALWEDGTVAVDEADIVDILHAIRTNARSSQLSAKEALGVLTSLPRNEWARARRTMVAASSRSAESLNIVDSALFVLVLDEYVPETVHKAASNMLHGTYKVDEQDSQIGTCCNRWYDKLQIIVCGDGTSGINFEHSAIDGHTALRFVSDIYAETVVNFAQSITKLIHGHGHLPHVVNAEVKRAASCLDSKGHATLDVFPKKLSFEFPTEVLERIYFAETSLGDQIVASDMVILEFKKYGKLLIVANNLSPDSFVQMSMLLAYYRLYGKIVCMYEPVLTKHFYHGRTEAMRPSTPAAADFCKTWVNPSSTAEQKLSTLIKATKEHSRLVLESFQGKGVDRHLFALKSIAERNHRDMPEFFLSSPWKKLNHTILSTSNCGNPALRLFGFGPVVPDGFGIGYIIKDNGIQYSVSSKHRQTRRYVNVLESTLIDFNSLLKPVNYYKVDSGEGHDVRQSLKDIPICETPVNLDSYGDIYGEASAPAVQTPTNEANQHGVGAVASSFTKYFSTVRRQASIQNKLLPGIGVHVRVGSDDHADGKDHPTEKK